MAKAKVGERVGRSSARNGSVSDPVGSKDAAEISVKAELAAEVVRLIESKQLSQAAAAALLATDQPKISALKHYKLEGFSVERLMAFLAALGQDVEIRIKSRELRGAPGRIVVGNKP